jgi:hypothetical protein
VREGAGDEPAVSLTDAAHRARRGTPTAAASTAMPLAGDRESAAATDRCSGGANAVPLGRGARRTRCRQAEAASSASVLEDRSAEGLEVSDDADKKRSDARRAVLARRATFVAAALASVACGKEPGPVTNPQPCLNVASPQDLHGPENDASTDDASSSTSVAVTDASSPAVVVDGGAAATDAGKKVPPPKATVTPPPLPTRPLPCLTPKRPTDK